MECDRSQCDFCVLQSEKIYTTVSQLLQILPRVSVFMDKLEEKLDKMQK